MGGIDILVFVVFIALVLSVGVLKSRAGKGDEQSAQDFFLAGRGLTWWLIGFSLIAANISTEQFVGMSGNAASHVGLAIASYEWMACITLVVVAFAFLPYFLRAGIYTMPEFLEYRYNSAARLLMAAATVLIYLLLLGAVTYSGALTVKTLGAKYGYEIGLWQPSLFIALFAMIYVVAGGLKASVWADLLQGSALILGGAIIMYFAFVKLGDAEEAATVVDVATGEVAVQQLDPEQGAFDRFMDLNSNRLNMFLPKDDNVLPWTALLLGLWIPNFYYWGLNQYITQRTLGSSSLAEGQRGIVFAAFLKLIIPFVVVIPGIIAFNLFHHDMRLDARGDSAKAMAMYLSANPGTDFVERVEAPDNAAVEAHTGPKYLLAIYPDADAIKAIEANNPFVLPMAADKYAELSEEIATYAADQYQLFDAKEDHAWQHVNPELAAEVDAYNETTEAKAKEEGKPTATQALVAYKYDTALGQLLGMLPENTGLLGFVLVALLGAVISSLAAMLNAASSVFTLDLASKFIIPNASQATIVGLGRICVVAFAVIAFMLAPLLGNPNISNSIFTIIQESQGLVSPGILAVFVVGLLSSRCPRIAGLIGLLTSMICYAGLKFLAPDIQFLNRMAIVFGICLAVMTALTYISPLKEPITFESKTDLNLEQSKGARTAGIVAIVLTLVLYAVFSPLVIAK
ncbi:MAG: sodium:proton symporter [Planctomycetaceae bacterium]|nr:sodium:proton symporter [Planctomycetaceae bacterium]